MNKDHKDFQDKVKEFYLENIDKINDIRNNQTFQGLPLPKHRSNYYEFFISKT